MSTAGVRERGLSVWRRVLSLSWPMMIQHVFRTLMRTTDVIVTGLFSPAAVAAVGLADLYARFPLRIGLGLGSGAIALSSQDTGGEAIENRDQAITQAILIGLLSGVPFIAFGFLFGQQAIALLGAPETVAEMGGTYLAVVFASAPARHVALVGARALQGTGDTRTPMYVDVTSSVLNIAGSLVLGLGLFGAPRLAIVGVGIATAVGNCFTAGVLSLAIWSSRTEASFTRPRDLVIARQLLAVSAPRIAEGLVRTLAEFPFNALLLTFGTDVNAAYQIGRRMYQQVTSPLGRAYHTATSVVVGQSLGDGDVASARFQGWATTVLAVATMGAIGLVLFFGADWFVAFFTGDQSTAGYATGFARAYAVAAPAIGAYLALSGALQGGSDTRTPFIAQTTGLFGFLLGFGYLTSVVLGWGVVGIYAAIALQQFWALAVVAWGFARGDWAAKAAAMMDERGSAGGVDGEPDAEADPTD
ncbi:MATE family efflux transporter [Halosimplex aquaticum]|uniref:Multidrug-efflux transporter n=1 Tax=Halosimplex aquaticum TaxID=3026162 RepID=A0ABD5Y614_9EURY|nr:MATE family efflux transporter [Halosimplex aquaticum]